MISSPAKNTSVQDSQTATRLSIIFPARKDNGYLYDLSQASNVIPEDKSISIPLNADTEYLARLLAEHKFLAELFEGSVLPQQPRSGITTQMSSIVKEDNGQIFVHPEYALLIPRHPIAKSEFHVVDYLNRMGYVTSLRRVDKWSVIPKNVCHIQLYAQFAVAEIDQISDEYFREDLRMLMAVPAKKKAPKFEMRRRLALTTPRPSKSGESFSVNYVDMPWIITIDGEDFKIRLSVVDTCALHGIANYEQLCEATGVPCPDKNLIADKDKGDMLRMAIECPEKFDAYALGDLHVYDILAGNAEQFKQLYRELGLEGYYTEPKLTMGATVRDLFMAAILNHIGVAPDDKAQREWVEENLMKYASAQYLRTQTSHTTATLAKVFGGRCLNNRSTDIVLGSNCELPKDWKLAPEVKSYLYPRAEELINEALEDEQALTLGSIKRIKKQVKAEVKEKFGIAVDIDISSCYGEGQRNQLYMLGRPRTSNFKADSKVNAFWSVKHLRKVFKDELVPGAWKGIVSTKEPLKYAQDFIPSWFLPNGSGHDLMAKHVATMKSDTERADTEATSPKFNEEAGNLKMLKYEIHNGVITHDALQWMDYACSPQQKKELEDKLYVSSWMVYAKSDRVDSYEELKDKVINWTGQNTEKLVGKNKQLQNTDGECHAWYGVNLGELLVDDLIANRKLYPKKTPMNTLYKLCVNTLYGDMTSKYFTSANTCVGDNITARARALCYYMEKGLNGYQSITDGTMFNLLDVVVKADKAITAHELAEFHQNKRNSNLKTGVIGGYENIELSWVELTLKGKKPEDDYTKYYPSLKLYRGGSYETMSPYVDAKYDKSKGKWVAEVVVPAMAWIDSAAMKHLQELFPGVDVLHADTESLKPIVEDGKLIGKEKRPRKGQFSFEAKDYNDGATFQGAANYFKRNPNPKECEVKARSYEAKKKYHAIKFESGKTVPTPTGRYEAGNPARDLLTQLTTNPERVVRQQPFFKDAILKVSDYKNRLPHWQELKLVPGDSFFKAGMMREFSLSQFKFNTLEQLLTWEKVVTRAKDKYGQSLEMFFLNEDGTLNYRKMCQTVDKMIARGVIDPFKELDPNNKLPRLEHPGYQDYLALKSFLNNDGTETEEDDFEYCDE